MSLQTQEVQEAIHKATGDVFRTMLQSDPQLNHAAVARDGFSDLSAIIGISGSISGFVAFRCPSMLAMDIAATMFGIPFSDVTSEVKDAVGEVTNMVAGRIKLELDPHGTVFSMSPPTVVSGDHELHSCGSGVLIKRSFDVKEFSFGIEFFYREDGKKRP